MTMTNHERIRKLTAALRDARRYIAELEASNRALQVIANDLRKDSDDLLVRKVKAACKTLGIDYVSITERNSHGNLYRDRYSMIDRGAVIDLCRRGIPDLGILPMSYPEIAKGMRVRSHSTIMYGARQHAKASIVSGGADAVIQTARGACAERGGRHPVVAPG